MMQCVFSFSAKMCAHRYSKGFLDTLSSCITKSFYFSNTRLDKHKLGERKVHVLHKYMQKSKTQKQKYKVTRNLVFYEYNKEKHEVDSHSLTHKHTFFASFPLHNFTCHLHSLETFVSRSKKL